MQYLNSQNFKNMSKQFAIAVPILKGKTEQWKNFSNELKTTYNKEFNESRKKFGVQERSYFQSTLQGDLVVLTLEGKDPQDAFLQLGRGIDEFSKWFNTQVKEIHGFDMTLKPTSALPELILETKSITEYA